MEKNHEKLGSPSPLEKRSSEDRRAKVAKFAGKVALNGTTKR